MDVAETEHGGKVPLDAEEDEASGAAGGRRETRRRRERRGDVGKDVET